MKSKETTCLVDLQGYDLRSGASAVTLSTRPMVWSPRPTTHRLRVAHHVRWSRASPFEVTVAARGLLLINAWAADVWRVAAPGGVELKTAALRWLKDEERTVPPET